MFKCRLLASLLLLWLWVNNQALGQSDTTSVERDKPQQNPPATESWLDNWHSNFSESMDYTAQRLDEFFALADSDEHENARAEGRVRFGWEPRTRDLAAQDFRFRVRVKLPALKDRVDLMLSDDESYDRDHVFASFMMKPPLCQCQVVNTFQSGCTITQTMQDYLQIAHGTNSWMKVDTALDFSLQYWPGHGPGI